MKKKIVLIGMMGSGKSTIGKILSKMLKFNFIDTDIFIEKKYGIKITKIFDKYGEEYFRRKEEKIVLKILCYKSSSPPSPHPFPSPSPPPPSPQPTPLIKNNLLTFTMHIKQLYEHDTGY